MSSDKLDNLLKSASAKQIFSETQYVMMDLCMKDKDKLHKTYNLMHVIGTVKVNIKRYSMGVVFSVIQ